MKSGHLEKRTGEQRCSGNKGDNLELATGELDGTEPYFFSFLMQIGEISLNSFSQQGTSLRKRMRSEGRPINDPLGGVPPFRVEAQGMK